MMLQIMPPTAEAKLSKTEWADTLQGALSSIPERKRTKAKEYLGELTFLETEQLVMRLMAGSEDFFEEFELAATNGTLARMNGDKNWKQTSEEEGKKLLRLPSIGFQPPQQVPPPRKRSATKKKVEPGTSQS